MLLQLLPLNLLLRTDVGKSTGAHIFDKLEGIVSYDSHASLIFWGGGYGNIVGPLLVIGLGSFFFWTGDCGTPIVPFLVSVLGWRRSRFRV